MGRVYGLGRWGLFRRVLLPGALPSVLVGVRYALGVMWLTLIVAETIAANSGIGYMAMNAREFLLTDVVVLSILLDGLGLVLGHGVSRFDPRPGRANSPAPGKRPLHNMCPTVVTKDGKPVLALGATGGRRIVNAVFDVLAYRLGQSLPLADAVKAPRVHTEGDTVLSLEATWPAAVTDHLKAVGYDLKTGSGASLNALERDPVTGALRAAAR